MSLVRKNKYTQDEKVGDAQCTHPCFFRPRPFGFGWESIMAAYSGSFVFYSTLWDNNHFKNWWAHLDIYKVLEQFCLAQQIGIALNRVGDLQAVRSGRSSQCGETYLGLIHSLTLDLQLPFGGFPILLLPLSLGCGLGLLRGRRNYRLSFGP